jgi:hypothetical protein
MGLRRALAAGVAIDMTLALAAAYPVFADEIADGVAAMPGAVEDVRIGGTWQREGKAGTFRIVVARRGGNDVTARMFVQWVSYEIDGTATVEDSIEIMELANLAVDVVDFTSESDVDGLTVYIQTLNPNDATDLTYELFVFSPTEYRFNEASN